MGGVISVLRIFSKRLLKMAQGKMKVKNRDKVPSQKKHVHKVPKKGPKPMPKKGWRSKQSDSQQIKRAVSQSIDARNEQMFKQKATQETGKKFKLLSTPKLKK